MRSEEQCGEKFGCASEKAESLDIPVSTVVPSQERKRKVPVRFQHSPTVSQVGALFESVEAYFRSSVNFTFLDTMTEKLNRRFKGDTGSPTARIIQSFHPLTVHANWVSTPNAEAKEAVHILCDFYGADEDNLKIELKVFHSSFPAKEKNLCHTEGNQRPGHLLVKMIQIYATLPVTTASVEGSFSKLKMIKIKRRCLCGEERLSDLLLLAIKKDIQINHGEVIRIFKDMAPRRMLV